MRREDTRLAGAGSAASMESVLRGLLHDIGRPVHRMRSILASLTELGAANRTAIDVLGTDVHLLELIFDAYAFTFLEDRLGAVLTPSWRSELVDVYALVVQAAHARESVIVKCPVDKRSARVGLIRASPVRVVAALESIFAVLEGPELGGPSQRRVIVSLETGGRRPQRYIGVKLRWNQALGIPALSANQAYMWPAFGPMRHVMPVLWTAAARRLVLAGCEVVNRFVPARTGGGFRSVLIRFSSPP